MLTFLRRAARPTRARSRRRQPHPAAARYSRAVAVRLQPGIVALSGALANERADASCVLVDSWWHRTEWYRFSIANGKRCRERLQPGVCVSCAQPLADLMDLLLEDHEAQVAAHSGRRTFVSIKPKLFKGKLYLYQ